MSCPEDGLVRHFQRDRAVPGYVGIFFKDVVPSLLMLQQNN